MSPIFDPPALVTDPYALAASAKAFLEENLPGWRSGANGGPVSVEDLLIDAFSFPLADQAEMTKLELIEAYKGIGGLHGVFPILAKPATAQVTFTLENPAPAEGFTIPLGSIVGIRDATGELVGFRLPQAFSIAVGLSSGAAPCEATTPGSYANNLGGAGVLISAPLGVAGATVGTSGGGEDEEGEEAFLTRLTEANERIRPSVVRAADAAAEARSVPGVGRAAAVDLLNPSAADGGEGLEEAGVEKCVTVAVTDALAKAPSSALRKAVLEALQVQREFGFKFFVVAPHYEEIDVNTVVYAWPGRNPADVKAEVAAALAEALSPERYGGDASRNPKRWLNDPVIRQSMLFRVVGDMPGVRWGSVMLFGKHGSALSTSDYVMNAGSAVPVLPKPGTITVTVEGSS